MLERQRLTVSHDADISHFHGIVGKSQIMQTLFHDASRLAKSDAPILILGESGTGKELLARAIHQESPRHDQPFVPINCASIPADLMESEFFGHVKGAFTGANEARKGLFQSAQGGSLFLDEIGEMPINLQAKLLRALQERPCARWAEKEKNRLMYALSPQLTATWKKRSNRRISAATYSTAWRHFHCVSPAARARYRYRAPSVCAYR